MRVVMLGLALAVLIARPAGAGRMLYASAASDDRIDGFCLRRNGEIEGSPRVRMSINGVQPRRLIVKDGVGGAPDGVDDVLFVVEADRVEAFQIGDGGGLRFIGRTPPRARSGPRDVAFSLSTTTQMIYVPDRSRSRVLGHSLPLPRNDAEQLEPFRTCIERRNGAGLQNLLIPDDRPRRLYVSASGGNGRIEVLGIDADGNLFGGEDTDGGRIYDDCAGTTTTTTVSAGTTTTTLRGPASLSERRRIPDVKSFAISGNLLYAEDRTHKRIRAFQLENDGNFTPPDPGSDDKFLKAVDKADRVAPYQQIVLFPSSSPTAILATQFFHGRIDSYELEPGGLLPKRPRLSDADLRLTPVQLEAVANLNGVGATVYVAAGEFDRIIAYRLNKNGGLAGEGAKPFSQTEEQKDSFPNDVAIAMLRAGCPD